MLWGNRASVNAKGRTRGRESLIGGEIIDFGENGERFDYLYKGRGKSQTIIFGRGQPVTITWGKEAAGGKDLERARQPLISSEE